MWHCHVVDGYIDSVFKSMRTSYAGPATLCQDLTVFNVTPAAVVARQAQVNLTPHAKIGPSETEPHLDQIPPPPEWWAKAAIDWQSLI